jgi:two-component system, OmpR family, alkaline phosphatase synthesis response regulator PhoP
MKARILIVEDEQHIGRLVKFNCEAEGFQAVLVGDGRKALAELEAGTTPFDLVILDLMLPEMSGYAVLEQLRTRSVQVPVLILSARTLSEDKIRGFDCGADQYMTKPFELPELLSRVRSLITRHAALKGASLTAMPQSSLQSRYAFNTTEVDFARHEVTVRGEPRQLTALEMKLLKCFIEHEGKLLSRAELLDQVWGFDATPTTRTVDNFIVRLRQYFETDPSHPRHFLSIRGMGYRFVANPTVTASDSARESENGVGADSGI